MKIFRCNPYLAKFKIRHLYYIFLNSSYGFKWTYQTAKNNYLMLTTLYFLLTHLSINFPSLLSHPLAYTNPTIFMDARQWALTLLFCFLVLPLFIATTSRNKLIIIVMIRINVLMPHFFCSCVTNQSGTIF